MEYRQIEHFLAICDHGSFTQAAVALHVAQPSLSHSIKTLERELQATLFHRLSRGVRLSPAGEAFAESARRIVRDMEIARTRVHEVCGLVAGRLDLIALPGILLDPLASCIGHFREQHPAVWVRVQHAESADEVRDAVRCGAAELGLTDTPESAKAELSSELVAEDEFVAVLAPGSSPPASGVILMRDLVHMDLVTGPVGSSIRDLVSEAAAGFGMEFTPGVEVELRGAALYLALAGAGVAVLPRPLAELGLAHGAVLVPLHPPQRRRAYLLRRGASLSPAARVMQDILTNNPSRSSVTSAPSVKA